MGPSSTHLTAQIESSSGDTRNQCPVQKGAEGKGGGGTRAIVKTCSTQYYTPWVWVWLSIFTLSLFTTKMLSGG